MVVISISTRQTLSPASAMYIRPVISSCRHHSCGGSRRVKMASSSVNPGVVAGILVVLAVAVEPQGVFDVMVIRQNELLHLVKGHEEMLNSIKDECVLTKQLELLELKINAGLGCLGRGPERNIPIGNLPANYGMPSPDMLHDIAPGKTTSSSGIHGEHHPRRAIDSGDESMFHSLQERHPWWLIDLGSERVIYHIMILSRRDCCSARLHDLEIRLGTTCARMEISPLLISYISTKDPTLRTLDSSCIPLPRELREDT
ncbi:uncharacterized protein [Macrobrachium rosenbergii]|uniref:uncharacterized protein isoform X2 n=1 Tax=Macrobrachium rosenbergii TaxID=79674 RepID=UPI0034D5057E